MKISERLNKYLGWSRGKKQAVESQVHTASNQTSSNRTSSTPHQAVESKSSTPPIDNSHNSLHATLRPLPLSYNVAAELSIATTTTTKTTACNKAPILALHSDSFGDKETQLASDYDESAESLNIANSNDQEQKISSGVLQLQPAPQKTRQALQAPVSNSPLSDK